MIYRRAIAKLRAQDWFAIGVEVAIVIVGVFIGNWVNDWRQAEAEQQEIGRLVAQTRAESVTLLTVAEGLRRYYATTGRFANIAQAGWEGDPKVGDRAFVIAAYQASQIAGMTSDANGLSTILGGDQVRKISDPIVRKDISRLLNFDFSQINPASMQTRYRDDVREALPLPAQEKIRARCGDFYDRAGALRLPTDCNPPLTAGEIAKGAAALRANPQLAHELALHQSAVATFLFALGRLESDLRAIERLNP